MSDERISIVVKFHQGVPGRLRGGALMAMEKYLRDRGCEAYVYLERRPDDLKSRAAMTEAERTKL